LADYLDNVLTIADLDFESAAHPCMFTHTVYGYVGVHFDDWCRPTFMGVGASYEFGPDNSSLDRWMVWGKIGMSY
jgi:hypothetical protein